MMLIKQARKSEKWIESEFGDFELSSFEKPKKRKSASGLQSGLNRNDS
jgi:hypothetical protein